MDRSCTEKVLKSETEKKGKYSFTTIIVTEIDTKFLIQLRQVSKITSFLQGESKHSSPTSAASQLLQSSTSLPSSTARKPLQSSTSLSSSAAHHQSLQSLKSSKDHSHGNSTYKNCETTIIERNVETVGSHEGKTKTKSVTFPVSICVYLLTVLS